MDRNKCQRKEKSSRMVHGINMALRLLMPELTFIALTNDEIMIIREALNKLEDVDEETLEHILKRLKVCPR